MPRRPPMFVLMACAFACAAPLSPARAERGAGDFACGTPGTVQGWINPRDSVVVARLVFVGFPDQPDRLALPAWAPTMRDELVRFVRAMSRGRQRLDLQVLSPPNAPERAWIAPQPAALFPSYGELNTRIFEQIRAAYLPANAWAGVEQVFIVHSNCAWRTCGIAGIGSLGPLTRVVQGFNGVGTTQHLNDGLPVDDARNMNFACYVAGHEYGHMLGLDHSPYSRTDQTPHVNMGRYDLMSGSAGYGVTGLGLLPYHPLHLSMLGWLRVYRVPGNAPGLRVPEVRRSGFALRVDTPDPSQWFLLVNHQGVGFDAKYGGTGLLVWHILERRAWDLESAAGKLRDGQPDPVRGLDPLEASNWNLGTAADFFDGGAGRDFSPGTNPSTNLYEGEYGSPQSRASFVNLMRVARVPGSPAMAVDVRHGLLVTDTGPASPPRLAVQAESRPGGARFVLQVPRAGRAWLDLYRVDGRRLVRVLDRDVEPGTHEIIWSGTDARGRRTAAGLYFFDLHLDADRRTGKLLLAR